MLGHDKGWSGAEDWTMQSDQGEFNAIGIPFVYFGVEDHPDYHQPTDDVARIDPEFFLGVEPSHRTLCGAGGCRSLGRGSGPRGSREGNHPVSLAGDELLPLFDALAFSADRHRMQRRKGATASPYINHPIEVARVLAHEGGVRDIDVLIAAVLHDTIEDTATTAAGSPRGSGRHRGLVLEVTDDKALGSAERKRLQVERPGHSRRRTLWLADKL